MAPGGARGTRTARGQPGLRLATGPVFGQSPESRIVSTISPREHDGMEEPSKISNRPRGLLDYWTGLCAVLLVVIVVYAVFNGA